MTTAGFLFDLPEPKKCEHKHVRLTLTPNLIHYAREDCEDCHKFVRWVARPADSTRSKKIV